MIAELLIGTIVAISCGGLAYLATRPKKKEEAQPEAPYKIEPQNVDFYTGFVVPEKPVEQKVEILADYIAEVSVQESVQVEQPAVEEAPVKKKRKYTRKAKPAAEGGQ